MVDPDSPDIQLDSGAFATVVDTVDLLHNPRPVAGWRVNDIGSDHHGFHHHVTHTVTFTTRSNCDYHDGCVFNINWQSIVVPTMKSIVVNTTHLWHDLGFSGRIIPFTGVQWVTPDGQHATTGIYRNGQEFLAAEAVRPTVKRAHYDGVNAITRSQRRRIDQHGAPDPTPTDTPTHYPMDTDAATSPTSQSSELHTEYVGGPARMPDAGAATTSEQLPTTADDRTFPRGVDPRFDDKIKIESSGELLRLLNTPLRPAERAAVRYRLAERLIITVETADDPFLVLHNILGHRSARDTLAFAARHNISVGQPAAIVCDLCQRLRSRRQPIRRHSRPKEYNTFSAWSMDVWGPREDTGAFGTGKYFLGAIDRASRYLITVPMTSCNQMSISSAI